MQHVPTKILLFFLLFSLVPGFSWAGPEQDLKVFRKYFLTKFPDVPLYDFVNGIYAIDKSRRTEWEAMEEFPPYEIEVAKGEELFKKKFRNGKSLATCFKNGGIGIRQAFPYFDRKQQKVITLELAINDCLKKNGERPLSYAKGELAQVSAYMAWTSRGRKISIKTPSSPDELKAYNAGKSFFYARRGQLNFSCAHCHVANAGLMMRADLLSPALGHVSHFPVYRKKWESQGKPMGTLHRRFIGCIKQARAKAFKAQSEDYRNLEYFLTYMSNGLPINGPGIRP